MLTRFLYRQPPIGYSSCKHDADVYRHFKYFIDKHDLIINPDVETNPMVSRILELNPAMRSRVRRASQLVTMGAISRHPTSGYFSLRKSHPKHPYHIKRNLDSGLWECNCPDENASIMMLTEKQTVELPVCKHLLAAMMAYRLRQNVKAYHKTVRKAA